MSTPTSTPEAVEATPTNTPMPRVEAQEVNFTTSHGLNINGKIYRAGDDLAVILAHQRGSGTPSNQRTWQFFAEEIADLGYTALTFNFRGIERSEGDINEMENLVVEDTRAAIDFLSQEGFNRIVCIGAEMGVTSCMEAAQDHELSGFVVITAVLSLGEPTFISEEDLANLTMPKLFTCSEENPYTRIPEHMQTMYDLSPEPKELLLGFPEKPTARRCSPLHTRTNSSSRYRHFSKAFADALSSAVHPPTMKPFDTSFSTIGAGAAERGSQS